MLQRSLFRRAIRAFAMRAPRENTTRRHRISTIRPADRAARETVPRPRRAFLLPAPACVPPRAGCGRTSARDAYNLGDAPLVHQFTKLGDDMTLLSLYEAGRGTDPVIGEGAGCVGICNGCVSG